MIFRKALAVAWLLVGALLLLDLLEHVIAGTSDPKSQVFRTVFLGLYVAAAMALWFQFKYSTGIAISVAVLAGLRSYLVLAIPKDIEWTATNIEALFVVILGLLSIIAALVVRRRRHV